MQNHETPQSYEVVDHQAKELVNQHIDLSESRINALNVMNAATTPEDRLATGIVFDNVMQLNRDHLAEASEFAYENLTQLKDQAMQEAVAAGKSIVEYKEPLPNFGRNFNLIDMIVTAEAFRLEGKELDPVSDARMKLMEDYCRENEIDPSNVPPEVLKTIQALPEWQDAENKAES